MKIVNQKKEFEIEQKKVLFECMGFIDYNYRVLNSHKFCFSF